MVRWYRDLLALRRARARAGTRGRAATGTAAGVRCSWSNGRAGRPEWFALARDGWRTVVNLGAEHTDIELGAEVTSAEVVLSWRGDAAAVDGRRSAVRVGPSCAAVVRVAEAAPVALASG